MKATFIPEDLVVQHVAAISSSPIIVTGPWVIGVEQHE
jgi:hypothetical protein